MEFDENNSELEETSEIEENSEIASEESSEESSEIDYSSLLESMQGTLESNSETLVLVQEDLEASNNRLDHVVTFLFIFAAAAFIFYIWRIFYGWFYKSV